MVNDELSKPLFGANYPSESEQSGKRVSNITMGWALKKHKSTRFSTAVKAYVNDKFLTGEEMGNKASPTQVAREMHRERDDKGNRLLLVVTVSVLNRLQHTFLILQQQKRNTVL